MNEESIIASEFSRRDFLRGSLLTAGAFALGGCATLTAPPKPRVRLPDEKLNLGAIGAGGKGSSDIDEMLDAGMNIVALCDVDEIILLKKAKEIREKNPNVRLYRDFRVMLEREKKLDAVTVSTPDHMHAPAAALAMSLGKHVYCQKPLTHTIWEARRLRELARQYGVVTQMGNQGSGSSELRRGVEVLQAGVIGPIREVHVWTNRPIWPQGIERPQRVDIVPDTLDWNLWLGVAPERPFVGDEPAPGKGKLWESRYGEHFTNVGVYHPFKWRGWHDFGTGALGDMACHTCNLAFRALDLGYATEVEAQTEGGKSETYPLHAKVRFQFPQRGNKPPVKFMWYEGGWKPDAELIQDVKQLSGEIPSAGCYFIGDKGRFFSAGDYGGGNSIRLNEEPKLRGIGHHELCKAMPETLPRIKNHYKEWVDACAAGKPDDPYSRFDIAAYLTEIILVGCIALRMPDRKIEWDGPNMRSPNTPEAEPLIRIAYRKGWAV